MKEAWKTTKFSQLADFNNQSINKGYPHKEIEYVDISSVETGLLKGTTKYTLSEAPGRAKRLVRGGDTIVANVRPNRRSFYFFKNPQKNIVVSTGFTVISPHRDLLNPRFAYYLISNQSFTDYLVNHAKGAAYPAVDTEVFRNVQLSVPDLDQQKKIAEVLSAYDDLIENNNRRIRILEEMAQKIYTEWFVNFRFPGNEKVKIVKDGLPEGWESVSLGEKIEVKRGKNITKNTVSEGGVAVVAGGIEPAYYHDTSNASAPVITISASGANAGFVNLYFEDIWASDCSYINKEATEFVFFYYSLLKSKQNEVTNLQRGSAQPHVYPKDLMSLRATLPKDSSLIRRFETLISPLYLMVGKLKKEIDNLKKTRDLLIPQLVTGKLEVKA